MMLQNPEVAKQFVSAYKNGFLPRGVSYSQYDTIQSYQTKLVFNLLYYANNLDIFYKVISHSGKSEPLYDTFWQQQR
jgi:hypothetical protein